MNRPVGVLYVDADRLCHSPFGRIAARAGFIAQFARTADEAREIAREVSFSIVAIDVGVPDADPLALVEHIHRIQPEVAIILIATERDLALPRSASASIISEIVFKSWDTDEMLHAMGRARMLNAELVRARMASMAELPDVPAQVLVVQADPAEAQIVELALDPSEGRFELIRVGRLSEAIQILQARPCDLVMIDLSLPDARGLSAVVAIRQVDADVPMIVLSGLVGEVVATQAVQIGADDLLVKGDVSVPQLARAARFAIERRRARRRYESHRSLMPVTGLPNDTAFYQRLKDVLQPSPGRSTSVGVILVEVIGADKNDELLEACSDRIRAFIRTNEFVAYLGRGFFGIIVNTTDPISETVGYLGQCFELTYRLSSGDVEAAAIMAAAIATDGEDPSQLIARVRSGLVDRSRRRA